MKTNRNVPLVEEKEVCSGGLKRVGVFGDKGVGWGGYSGQNLLIDTRDLPKMGYRV